MAQTQAVAERIEAQDYDEAMRLRGGTFRESYRILQTMQQAAPRPNPAGRRQYRVAIVHGGGPAPGMNAAVRAAVRLGLDRGYTVVGINNGFRGLRDGDIRELGWMDVSSWASHGGAELGTNRYAPDAAAIAQIAEQITAHRIDGLLMAGGWAGYRAAHEVHRYRQQYSALDIPIVCMPMTINNDVPATELSIGSDTALNSIVADVDKIRQSAVSTRRVFVVEVMGHDCGYLALLSGLATAADRIYLPEEGITLDDLGEDVQALTEGFRVGKRLGLIVRSEGADRVYTTEFLTSLFEKEGGELFDARQAILGHIQEGGDPSPFDRIHATSLTAHCIEFFSEQFDSGGRAGAMIGLRSGQPQFTDLTSYPTLLEHEVQRPIAQQWMDQRDLALVMRS
ncbi:6-phosphofructokinase [Mycobacterium sp. ACS1612]|uniref:6-phosphofructokinase n=1 Tax=Mycobacterium sp. ACS1612 TaxID=1834117 RepID=UPI001E45E016|nr:6-phosphofructokinase [Mycobacterium sp. ACS1612]